MSIIKSFSVGNGDMFYIEHNSDNFTTIDCCYDTEENRDKNFNEIKEKSSKKGITRFISTHPDEDHIKGIKKFDDLVHIYNFYVVENKATKPEETENFKKYCELRDGKKAFYVKKDCRRKWMNLNSSERGSSGINFLWPDVENKDFKVALLKAKEGVEFNNISPIFTYSLQNGVTAMWMGDMETTFLEKIENTISWPKIDILFAPHHGRESGKVSSNVLDRLNPKIIVIGEAPSENLNYYNNYNTITQNSAGDITFVCEANIVHVYISSVTYNVGFLRKIDNHGNAVGNYIGSFRTKGA